jgi:NO-binding membrane sensor protein with MHYT domain
MFRVYTCLTVDHDWRLVVLAGAVCFLASAVAISLFYRAQASMGRARLFAIFRNCIRGQTTPGQVIR